MAKILIAEDESNIREGLGLVLKSAGYSVIEAGDGVEALELYFSERPDLLLLDVMMPRKSGYEVCVEVRKSDPAIPIMMLSALSEEKDKVLGLGLGADDYIVKPFAGKIAELLARVAAALRRADAARPAGRSPSAEPSAAFDFGGFKVDVGRMTIAPRENPACELPLSNRELDLLKLFNSRPGEVLTRDTILNAIWGVNYFGTTRTLDQYIAKLRKKLGGGSSVIETVSCVGYRYNDQLKPSSFSSSASRAAPSLTERR